MLACVRAGLTAALLALAFIPALPPPTKPSSAPISTEAARQAGGADQDRRRRGHQAGGAIAQRGRRRLPEKRFPHRHAGARPTGHRRARRRRRLAAAGPHHAADQAARRPRARLLARARLDRRLHRLSARQRSRRGSRQPRAARPHVRATASCGAPALDAHAARRSICARAPTLRGAIRTLRDEHGFRMLDYTVDSDAASPRACFQFSEELPGKRTDFSPFVAVAGIDKPAISADEKQLCVEGLKHGERYTHHAARRPAVGRSSETLAQVGRLHHLCARPQAVRALFRQGLCAAAHRPARHPGAQRQHRRRSSVDDLPHRRPQPDRHRARQRLPAQPRPLRAPNSSPASAAPRSGKAS